MPVTARLLHRLQETLGEEATSDLMAWWQEAAAVNRTETREVAELYFQRFRAELDKGMAELRAEIQKGLGEERSEGQKGLSELRATLDTRTAELRAELANQRAELIKWMFIFWAGTVFPLAGLAVALAKL